MNVTIKYVAQIKRAAGTGSESVQLSDNATVQDCLSTVTQKHPDLKGMLFTDAGALHSTILVFVGEDQIEDVTTVTLKDGDVITLLSPIAGG